jgi:hypothetical protein
MMLGAGSPASVAWRAASVLAAVAIGLVLLSQASVGVRAAQGDSATTGSTAAPTATSELGRPTPEAPIDAGDPRSDGQGPGIVGEPLLVLLAIVLVGVATVVVTVIVARTTGRA